MVATGLALRLGIARVADHNSFDLDSAVIVENVMRTHPFTLYTTSRWPYPPGFVPWLLVARELSNLSDRISFAVWLELPSMVADAALIYLVATHLAWKGASRRVQQLAAATIAFGPVFVILSSYEVQLDSVAILPAVLALIVWERRPEWVHRGMAVGLLLGVGAALKTSPLLLVVAFLPTARSWRERAQLIATSAAIPLMAVAPWLVADFAHTTRLLRYSGLPGVGGLSLVVQPSLAEAALEHRSVPYGDAALFFVRHGQLVLAPFYLAAAFALFKWRVEASLACAVVWLTFYAFAPNFFYQYLIWGIPFFLLAGFVRSSAAFVALMAVPHVVAMNRPWSQAWVVTGYSSLLIVVWAGYVVALGVLLVRAARSAHAPLPADVGSP